MSSYDYHRQPCEEFDYDRADRQAARSFLRALIVMGVICILGLLSAFFSGCTSDADLQRLEFERKKDSINRAMEYPADYITDSIKAANSTNP